jgi:hypothetical protein
MIQRTLTSKSGIPYMANVFDPKSTVPVVSGGRRRPELRQWLVIGGRIDQCAKKRRAEGTQGRTSPSFFPRTVAGVFMLP